MKTTLSLVTILVLGLGSSACEQIKEPRGNVVKKTGSARFGYELSVKTGPGGPVYIVNVPASAIGACNVGSQYPVCRSDK